MSWYKPDVYWTSGVYTSDKVWVWEGSEEAVGYESWCKNQPNATLTMELACPMKRKMKKMKMMKHMGMYSGHNMYEGAKHMAMAMHNGMG